MHARRAVVGTARTVRDLPVEVTSLDLDQPHEPA